VRLWSLAEDALVEEGARPGTLVVVSRWGEQVLAVTGAAPVESLRRMSFGPVALGNIVGGGDGAEDERAEDGVVRELASVLARVAGCVVHSLALPDGSSPLLSAEPLVAAPAFDPVPVPAAAKLRLSPSAELRPVEGVLVLEVPGAAFRVLLSQPLARVLTTALVAPTTAADLAAATAAPAPVVHDVLSFLTAAGVVELDTDRGRPRPDPSGWAHHELQFHARTRARTERAVLAPAPGPGAMTRPLPDGPRYPLHRPDLDAVAATDPSLTSLLEADHVCPDLAGGPVSSVQVGELLYRSARIRSTGRAHLPSAVAVFDYEASQRPYSSVANLYELELFLTLEGVTGLPRGIFHYDPLGHALTLVDDRPEHVGHVLDVGRVGVGSTRRSPVVITIGARAGRTSWIRPGGSYALSLLHCGAVQETLRLVATTMGLWAHAVPSDAQGVDELVGLDWPAEIGLGECVVDVLREADH
jgi:SagB-type dehydrogenase family enzyme